MNGISPVRTRIRSLLAVACFAGSLLASGGPALAQGVSLIRDAEIETTIRKFSTPVFEAAGLAPEDVSIYLVRDDRLNAFVAGGLNLFLNTGLIQRTEDPNQLIGVIAHETGHIAGGHLARLRDELTGFSAQSILAVVLGTAAAIASGDGGAAAAIISGGTSMAQQNLLRYSRTQEASADQAAFRFLDRTGQSTRGFVDFLEILGQQELIAAERQDPYLRTHPITTERIAAARQHFDNSPHRDATDPEEWQRAHARMRAKLDGFILPPRTTLARYGEGDRSVSARYARAIAYYRIPDLARALPAIDELIAEHPNDPYFHELRGQMLFENGRINEALPAYEKALQLSPRSPLLQRELARVKIETNDPAHTQDAVRLLEQVVRTERDDAGTWRLLGIAHGRQGQMGEASLALAESALIRRQHEDAMLQADRAQRTLKQGTPGWLRAEDIKRAAEDLRRKAEERS